MSSEAIVTCIITRPHPDADKLQLGIVAGHQVVTGLDIKSGQLGVFFPIGLQLSHEFCYNNNEYREGKGENKDKNKFGFFDGKRRVRSIKLRGAQSDGYWVPLNSLEWTGIDLASLKPGDTFTSLNGSEVCRKYINIATQRAIKNAQKQGKKSIRTTMFKEHYDTKKLRYTIDQIPEGARLIITEKLHGTSGRTGNLLVTPAPEQWPWWKRMAFRFGRWLIWATSGQNVIQNPPEWRNITGTRRVILDPDQTEEIGYYSGSTFRSEIHQGLSLKKGETIYYEIVGWEGVDRTTGQPRRPIMGTHKLEGDSMRKKLAKKYETSRMIYSYGCQPGEYNIHIYRITQTNEDGYTIELSWDQVKARCAELGLKHVPEIHRTVTFLSKNHSAGNYGTYSSDTIDADGLLALCKNLSEGPSILDGSHIKEGVCVRIESPGTIVSRKFKSWTFLTLEGHTVSNEDYVDPEDIS